MRYSASFERTLPYAFVAWVLRVTLRTPRTAVMEKSAPLLAPAVASVMRHDSAVVRKEAALAVHRLLGDAPLAMARCAMGNAVETQVRFFLFLWLFPVRRRRCRYTLTRASVKGWRGALCLTLSRWMCTSLGKCAAQSGLCFLDTPAVVLLPFVHSDGINVHRCRNGYGINDP